MATAQPIKIAILAMGGEGGGVLADWIVDLGEHNGFIAQTTSVPGVAQRTGATIYYVELFPRAQAEADGGTPVLALMPLPGDVDVVLASELMEAGRAVQRGLVTPDRTTLIASTHRVYSIAEKMALGDGRVDDRELIAHADRAAKRFVRFDMAQAADASGSVISAVLFGALAGTGVLPFARAQFEATVARSRVGVAASLKAFDTAYGRAATADSRAVVSDSPCAQHGTPLAASISRPPDASVPTPAAAELDGATDAPGAASADFGMPAAPVSDPQVRTLIDRVRSAFPAAAHPVLSEGVRRLIDYQDPAYAELYLDRAARIGTASGDPDPTLLVQAARHLALWMSYEDTIRVAELKTRGTRFARVQNETRTGKDQLLEISEFMHPRLQEICETLPAPIGRWLSSSGWPRRLVERTAQRGRVIRTSSLRGFTMLYAVARLKRWRRGTLRYQNENARIEQWLEHIRSAASVNPLLAVEIAQCQRLIKGYSDTHERGLRNYQTVMDIVRRAGRTLAPATLRELRDAALADEHGDRLSMVIAQHGLA